MISRETAFDRWPAVVVAPQQGVPRADFPLLGILVAKGPSLGTDMERKSQKVCWWGKIPLYLLQLVTGVQKRRG